MVTRNRNPPWTDLPQELLYAIANSLSNPIDILVFRSVCTSWRSSFPRLHPSLLSPSLPLYIPSPAHYFNCPDYIVTVTVVYSLRCPFELPQPEFSSLTPTSWISFLTEYNPGKISVRKPFKKRSYSLPVNFPKTINLIDFNARELGRFYNLSYANNDNDSPGQLLDKSRFISENVDKVVFVPNVFGLIVMFEEGKLAIIRLGLGINEAGQSRIGGWDIIHDGKGFRFDDIVEFKGRVLGIDRRARVYRISNHSPKIYPVVPPIAGGGGSRKRLVESLGLLYLVVRCRNGNKANVGVTRTDEFKVYELNEKKKKWIEISNIGDRSFFFGFEFSFSGSALELGSCGKNCILFNRQSFRSYKRSTGDICSVDKLKGDLDIGVFHLNDVDDLGAIESYPSYSDTLWPPPFWIWPFDRCKRFDMVESAIDEIINRIPESVKSLGSEMCARCTSSLCPPEAYTRQTKFQELKVAGVEVPGDDSLLKQHEMWPLIQHLKNHLNKYKESTQTVTRLQEEYSSRTDILNQLDQSLNGAERAIPVTGEMHDCVDVIRRAAEHFRSSLGLVLNSIKELYVKQSALVFQIEEIVRDLEGHYYSCHSISNT